MAVFYFIEGYQDFESTVKDSVLEKLSLKSMSSFLLREFDIS